MSDEHSEVDATDELLSALIDGELDPQAASQLQARIASEPALAERLAEFNRIDAALSALPAREVPADLGVRMRARIAEQQSLESPRAPITGPSRQREHPRDRPPRRARSSVTRRLWPVAAGLAAAAALALYLAQPAAVPDARIQTAQPAQTEQRPLEVEVPTSPKRATEPVSLLASADEDELGIALYYDELADLEMLEQLELLEALVAIEEAEPS